MKQRYKRSAMKKYILVFTLLIFVSLHGQSAKYFSETFADVVKNVNPAVVTITSEKVQSGRFQHPFEEFFGDDFFRYYSPERERRSQALGSGVIVDAVNGYILTNNHVVQDADEISIFLMDEREFEAEVVGTDPKSDLAVLRIDADNLTGVRLGDSDGLDVGEWVLAIGSPFSANLLFRLMRLSIRGTAAARWSTLKGNSSVSTLQSPRAVICEVTPELALPFRRTLPRELWTT